MLQIVCLSNYVFTLVLCFGVNAYNRVMQTPWTLFCLWPLDQHSNCTHSSRILSRDLEVWIQHPSYFTASRIPQWYHLPPVSRKSWLFKARNFSGDFPPPNPISLPNFIVFWPLQTKFRWNSWVTKCELSSDLHLMLNQSKPIYIPVALHYMANNPGREVIPF